MTASPLMGKVIERMYLIEVCGWSQLELGEKSGVPRPRSRGSRRIMTLGPVTIVKIAQALGLTPESKAFA